MSLFLEGYFVKYVNVGAVCNTGIDFGLNIVSPKIADIKWAFNFSKME